MGICNGFQILTEAKLLDGVLLRNQNQRFICDTVYIKPQTTQSALTRNLHKDNALKIPIAHAEGRFFAPADTIKRLEDKDQVLFTYCQADGTLSPSANPNGSIGYIAGICNEQRNVFGMMPHPERAVDPLLGNTDGLGIFQSMLQHL